MSRRGRARLAHLAAPLVLALTGLTACGDGAEEPAPTPSASTPEDDSLTIALTREGDVFTPNGERVDAGIDQPIALTITSDEAGELHVHTVPEQEISYEAGTSEHEIVIDRPGVVEVESHDPDVIVLQLEVR